MAKIKTPSQIEAEQQKRFQAESDLRILREAEQVKADRGRLNSAQRIAKEEMDALRLVQSSGKKAKKKGKR